MTRIGLIDYGMGNLHSVQRALERLDAEVLCLEQPFQMEACDALVLPGVGAFDPAMERLHGSGLAEGLRLSCAAGRPLLGICLGLQLLFEASEEGSASGLGLLPGTVRALPRVPHHPIPHMGWAPLLPGQASPLLPADHPEIEQIRRAGLPTILVDSTPFPAHGSVVVDDEVLGKPGDDRQLGAAMLRRLAGRAHEVLTGLAVAASGFTVGSNVLIVAGTLVGASGILLTRMMSKAMGRSLGNVLFSAFGSVVTASGDGAREDGRTVRSGTPDDIGVLLAYASKVVIIPGYGLAVAQAQHTVLATPSPADLSCSPTEVLIPVGPTGRGATLLHLAHLLEEVQLRHHSPQATGGGGNLQSHRRFFSQEL